MLNSDNTGFLKWIDTLFQLLKSVALDFTVLCKMK